MDLATLLDEREIIAKVIAYARSLDDRDWDLFLSCFTEEVDMDASGLRGIPPATLTREALLARVKPTVLSFDVTLHYSTNHQVTINGDDAVCRSYGLAHHTYREDGEVKKFTVFGEYTHRLRRTAAGWRICGVKLDFKIKEGQPPAAKP
jgi:3-phenylpropionate/cinnamic acid dioxygenase small subunit